MKKTALLILAASFAVPAIAADKDVEDLLKKMRDTYKNVGTAQFTMEATIQAENGDVTVKMDGLFKSPNLINVNASGAGGKANIVCDGTKVYAVVDGLAQIVEVPYSVDSLGQMLGAANLEVLNFFDWKRQLSTAKGDNMAQSKLSLRKNVKWNNKTWIVLEESAPTVDVYVEYYIDPKTNLVWRTVQMSLDKEFTRGDFIIKSMKTGLSIDEKKFKKPIITAP